MTIKHYSTDESRERIRMALAAVNMNEGELSDLAARYMVTPEERLTGHR